MLEVWLIIYKENKLSSKDIKDINVNFKTLRQITENVERNSRNIHISYFWYKRISVKRPQKHIPQRKLLTV